MKKEATNLIWFILGSAILGFTTWVLGTVEAAGFKTVPGYIPYLSEILVYWIIGMIFYLIGEGTFTIGSSIIKLIRSFIKKIFK